MKKAHSNVGFFYCLTVSMTTLDTSFLILVYRSFERSHIFDHLQKGLPLMD